MKLYYRITYLFLSLTAGQVHPLSNDTDEDWRQSAKQWKIWWTDESRVTIRQITRSSIWWTHCIRLSRCCFANRWGTQVNVLFLIKFYWFCFNCSLDNVNLRRDHFYKLEQSWGYISHTGLPHVDYWSKLNILEKYECKSGLLLLTHHVMLFKLHSEQWTNEQNFHQVVQNRAQH